MVKEKIGMVDFFDRQEEARRTTRRLLSLFIVVYFFLAIGTYFSLLAFIDFFGFFVGFDPEYLFTPLLTEGLRVGLHGDVLIMSLIGTAGFIAAGSLLKKSRMGKDGATIAESLGGVEVSALSEDPVLRRYVNVVEEMSLASGVPVPRTFVLPRQPGINGFAAGFTINDAAIAVTSGTLKYLNREELQALVAHEFSHILNGDMRLNMRLMGQLHGVMSIYLLGRAIVHQAFESLTDSNNYGRVEFSDMGRGNPAALFLLAPGVVLMILGSGGLIGSRIIKAGIARQREFLADASAIQFTRNPGALGSALKKIGGSQYGSAIRGSHAEEVSHMCFGEAASSWLTHPPLEDRISAVDPTFNPDEGYFLLDAKGEYQDLEIDRELVVDRPTRPADLTADEVVDQIGMISPEYLAYCSLLLEKIPDELMEARGDLAGAVAMTFLLLLSGDKDHKKAQVERLQKKASPSVAAEARKLWPVLRGLDQDLRLPLFDLLFPTLRKMTAEQYGAFRSLADELITLDGEVSFQEFVLERLVLHRLDVTLSDEQESGAQLNSFSGVSRDLENLLSAVAYAGGGEESDVERAFLAGKRALPSVIREKIHFREFSKWTYEHLGRSLDRLASSSPAIKRAVIESCAHTVLADQKVTIEERELLRIVCDLLDAPLPPGIARGGVDGTLESPRN